MSKLVITPDSYRRIDTHKRLADKMMERYGWDPNQVTCMTVGKKYVEVILNDFDDNGRPYGQWSVLGYRVATKIDRRKR